MKFLFTADVHLKLWSDKEYTDDGLPLKLVEILNVLEQMCEYAKKNKIKNIVIGGDLNDTKGIASVRAFVLFKKMVERYNDIHFYLLHGNHDAVASEYENNESAIQLVDGPENVSTILEPKIVENILFIPYSKYVGEEIRDVLSKNKDKDVNILISHFGLNEATLSSGISIKSSLSAKSLTMFDLVLLGHYHKPQMIEADNTKIYYVGSPIAIRRDEAGEEKRFFEVDSKDCKVKIIPSEGYRKYFEFKIDENSDVEKIKEEILKYQNEGHHIVLKNSLANVPKELEELTETVQYVDVYEPDVTIRGITAAMSDEEQMKKYMEIENIPEEDFDLYLNIGLECIHAASEEIEEEKTKPKKEYAKIDSTVDDSIESDTDDKIEIDFDF